MTRLRAVSDYKHENCPNGHPALTDDEILSLLFEKMQAGWSVARIADDLGMTEGRVSDVYSQGKRSFGPRLREIVSAAACGMATGSTTTFVRDGLSSGYGGGKRQQWLSEMEARTQSTTPSRTDMT